jgi:hypothetical protein
MLMSRELVSRHPALASTLSIISIGIGIIVGAEVIG